MTYKDRKVEENILPWEDWWVMLGGGTTNWALWGAGEVLDCCTFYNEQRVKKSWVLKVNRKISYCGCTVQIGHCSILRFIWPILQSYTGAGETCRQVVTLQQQKVDERQDPMKNNEISTPTANSAQFSHVNACEFCRVVWMTGYKPRCNHWKPACSF